MKKLLLFVLILASCGNPLAKDVFVGEWELSKDSPYYTVLNQPGHTTEMKITKADAFYKVIILTDGKDTQSEAAGLSNDKSWKVELEEQSKFELSPDKHFLISIVNPSNIIAYNDDNKLIQTPWGWFKRK